MPYNPIIHKRRSIRLKGYDYSNAGMYFITICCHGNQNRFGEIINNEMALNEYGKLAHDEWENLSQRFKNFKLDIFQIMPNHMHGIIILSDDGNGDGIVHAPLAGALLNIASAPNIAADASIAAGADKGAGASPAPTTQPAIPETMPPAIPESTPPTNPTIGNIIGAYKSLVSKKCLDIYKSRNEPMGKLWHRNYYEHIIRNETAYYQIAQYILNNPINWQQDKLFI